MYGAALQLGRYVIYTLYYSSDLYLDLCLLVARAELMISTTLCTVVSRLSTDGGSAPQTRLVLNPDCYHSAACRRHMYLAANHCDWQSLRNVEHVKTKSCLM